MEENGQVEIIRSCQIADEGKACEARCSHDAVRADFLSGVGTVQELQAVGGAVGDVHGFSSGLFIGIGNGHDGLQDSFLERRIVLIQQAVVVLDDGAAADSQVIDHLGQLLRRTSQGLDGGHEDGASFYAAELADAGAAEAGAGVIVIHRIGQFEGHETDSRLKARVSEKHIEELGHFTAYCIGVIGNHRVVSAFLCLFEVFDLTDDGVLDFRAFDQLVGAFHGLLQGDAEGNFFGFVIIRGSNAVGRGKAGGLFQIFRQFGK